MIVDIFYDFCLFRNDLRLTVITFAEGIEFFVLHGRFAFTHGLPFAPPDIGGYGFALCLCESPHHGDEDLAVGFHGVDVLFFEDDRDSKLFKDTDIVQTVHRVSCEAGDGLGQHHIDFLLFAETDHPKEFRSLPSRGAGYAFVCEDPSHGPVLILHDVVCIVGLLCFVACKLFFLVRGNTAIRSNTELPFGFR